MGLKTHGPIVHDPRTNNIFAPNKPFLKILKNYVKK